jgi:hypothetical protein
MTFLSVGTLLRRVDVLADQVQFEQMAKATVASDRSTASFHQHARDSIAIEHAKDHFRSTVGHAHAGLRSTY